MLPSTLALYLLHMSQQELTTGEEERDEEGMSIGRERIGKEGV